MRKTKAGHLRRIRQQGKRSMEESVSLKATVLRSHVSSAEKQIHCLSYRNVVWSLTSNNATLRSTRTKKLSLPFTGRSPQDLKEVTPSRRKPFTSLRFLRSKVEQRSRLSLSSRVEPVKVSARSLSRKWGQAEEERKKKPRTGGG